METPQSVHRRDKMSLLETPRTALGALVCDKSGKVLAAFGVAADDGVSTAAVAACRALPDMHEMEGVVFQVAVPGGSGRPEQQYIGLCVHDNAHRLVLLRDSRHELPLFDFIGTVPFASSILNYFITNPYQAITVADKEGKIRFISPVHERFLGLKRGQGYGMAATEAIPNSRLGIVAATGKAEIGQLQDMHGVTRVVNRIPITEGKEVVGAIGQILFKGPEALTQMQQRLSQVQEKMEQYRRELEELRAKASPAAMLIGSSACMQRLKREIETVARLDVPVLILGESGTGKELVAHAIHAAAHSAGKPLVSLNLAALPSTLLESELFGYAPGTFTGGKREGQVGKLEQAEGGTLFLDEVADIPMEVQVKLLRVLEDHMVERLGARTSRRVDFRIISATHHNFQSLIEAGRFRLDLYYRLSGVVLRVPALQQRFEDIPELLAHFVRGFCERNRIPAPTIASDLARYLAGRPWPGNVRQLRQKVEEALVFCDGKVLRVKDFTREDAGQEYDAPSFMPAGTPGEVQQAREPAANEDASSTLLDVEHRAVLDAIAKHGGNKKHAAESLGISRSYLYKILSRKTG